MFDDSINQLVIVNLPFLLPEIILLFPAYLGELPVHMSSFGKIAFASSFWMSYFRDFRQDDMMK